MTIREDDAVTDPPPLPPLSPIERRSFDYSDLDHWMAHADQAIRQAKRTLQALIESPSVPASV